MAAAQSTNSARAPWERAGERSPTLQPPDAAVAIESAPPSAPGDDGSSAPEPEPDPLRPPEPPMELKLADPPLLEPLPLDTLLLVPMPQVVSL